MLSLGAISTVAGLLAMQASLVASQDLGPCLNLSQYERGLCCMPDKPCPYDGVPPPTNEETAVPTYAVPEVWCVQGAYENECLDSNCAGDGFKAICGPQAVCICAAADGVSEGAPVGGQPVPVPAPEPQPTNPEPVPEEKPEDKPEEKPKEKPEEKPKEIVLPVPGHPGVIYTLTGVSCITDQNCEGDEVCKGDLLIGTCIDNEGGKECACKEKEKPPTSTKEEEPTTMATVAKPTATEKAEKIEKTCRRSSDCVSMACADNGRRSCKDGRCECNELYEGGTCKLHITNFGDNTGHKASVKVFDGSGNLLDKIEQVNPEPWGRTVKVPREKTSMPYDVDVKFLDGPAKRRKRDRPEIGTSPLLWQKNDLQFTVGETKWTSRDREEDKLPYCKVGKWHVPDFGEGIDWKKIDIWELISDAATGNTHRPITNTQDMDCYWKC